MSKLIDQELINFFKNQIESKSFRYGVSIEDSYKEIKSNQIKFYGEQEDKLKAIDNAFLELKRERSGIRSLKFASTISKKNQQEWYFAPDENIDLNWFAFKKYLLAKSSLEFFKCLIPIIKLLSKLSLSSLSSFLA